MAGALDGIKILDITNYIAGPFATMLLADLGAEVYKIETPGAGDPFRTWDKEPKDYSPSFCGMNRNKKSVTLDIKQTEGKEIFLRLAQDADVIVENLRPGVVDGCYGVLAAIAARERTGKGQKVETSLLEATISFIGFSMTQFLFSGEIPKKSSRLKTAGVYALVAGDGKPFVIHLSHPPKFWIAVTEVID